MNLHKMCRICGELSADRLETVQQHGEQIYKYLPIKDNDGFPKNLCLKCLSSIDQWNVFYNRCEEVQKKFTLLLKGKTIIKNDSADKPKSKPTPKHKMARNNNGQLEEDDNKKTSTPCDPKLTCTFCAVLTENEQQLNDHLISAHCDLVFCCDLCKNYKPRNDLITHMTEHALSSLQVPTQETKQPKITDKFQCPECEKTFATNSGLKHHVNSTHTAEKQFPCDECKLVFSSKRVLHNHIRSVHTKDKPFKCNECDKRFKTDSTLYAHRKTHSKETPHMCFECGKGFKFKHHLDVHSVQHRKKEKSFECSCCHKKFGALSNLTKHRKIHDKTVDYACHICGVKMTQKRYLRDHMKRVHQTRLGSLDGS